VPIHLRSRVACVVLLAMVGASGQGVAAFGAPSSAPPHAPSKAQSIAAQQSRAASAGQALGLSTGEGLVVKDVITDSDGTTSVRYNRTFDGLRVIGGDFVSHVDRSGKIKGVNWNGSHKVAVASTTPKVSLASAKAAGTGKASLVQDTTAATKGELVVYSGGASAKSTPRLAYDVLTVGVRTDQTPSRLHTIVDAGTGVTLASWDEIETGAGNGIYVGAVTIGTTNAPPWTMRDAAGNYATDLNGVADVTGTVSGTTFTKTTDNWGDGTVGDRASAGVDAQYGAEKTLDYFNTVLGRNGIWNTGVGARSRVHYGDAYENAFWDGTQMTYGDGAGNTNPVVELDVAGHEMTHGVTENTAGLLGSGEAGGLNEGTSDIFGTAVEWYANNSADIPDYLIGEKLNINGDGTPLRYMDQPSKDGLSRDCWSSTLGGLDPHYSSGPLNHWFYLASEGSGAKVINDVTYDSPTCNSLAVAGIGRDKAARIWYRTLTTYLTSGNTYAAAREGAIQSAKDIYGFSSIECTGVAASFSAIGVPPGAQTCGITPTPPVGSNLLSNPGFESGNSLWSATSDVIAQWGTDQPAHAGTWSAWLGGYGVAHDDSISQLVTIPSSSSATLSYYVHIDTDEVPNAAYDTMTVRAGSTVLQTLSNVNAANGYQLKAIDLSAYVGRTISLSFSGSEDAAAVTSFVVDDASVTTPSSPTVPGAPTGVVGTAADTAAVVSWTAPARSGASAVTEYTVTAAPGGRTATTSGATSATVTGLANGTAYMFTVTATNASGSSPASVASAAVTPRTVPGAPTGVLATPANAAAVVSWTAPTSTGGSPITGYTVTASPGGATATTSGATSATVSGLLNGMAYTFTVTAANAGGTSLASSASAAVTPRTAPGAPTAVSATPGGAQAVVTWTAPASNGGSAITGYTVTASRGGATATTSGATSATVSGLLNGMAYTFTVTAANAGGTSLASSASAAVTPRTVPGVPTAVTASAGNGVAVVSWTAPASNGGFPITGYTVTASPDGATATTSGATSATVTGLTNGMAYMFTVTATSSVGTSLASLASAAVTPSVRTVPGAPTGVSATAGNAQAVVSWTAPASDGDSAITGYSVMVVNAATSVQVGALRPAAADARSLTVTGLVNGTAYTFTVTATNATGISPASAASAAVTPRTVPGAPAAVTASAGNGVAVVSWTAPVSNGGSPITGYTVTAAPGGATATTSGATSVTVTGLTNGTAYTFTVTAANAAGTSLAPLTSASVTPRTVPGAPTGVLATAGNAQVVVSWTAPASIGGSAITGYSVMVVNAATSVQVGALRPAAAGATSLTVTGLTNGTGYTFQVLATNAVGPGAHSAMSNVVTPAGTAAVSRLSDFNRDGFTDLVARDSAGVLWLYPGNGAGGFKARHQMGTGWNIMTALLTPGDVTGDGNADILGRNAAGILWLYPGNGASGLGVKRQIGSGWNIMSAITAVANLNGAGGPDLLARDSAGVLWLYPLSGNAVFGTRRLVSSGWSAFTFTGPGDVSGDGRADILGRDEAGTLWLYRGDGTGGITGGNDARTLVSAGWAGMTALVTPGNWDRTNGNDLLARDAAGTLWLYPGNNAGGFAAARSVGSGWSGMTYIG